MIHEKVTEYSLCELPEGIDATAFTIRVQYAGKGRWAVRWMSACLRNVPGSFESHWDHEPIPSERSDEWLNWHRFNRLRSALAAARKALPTLEVNGMTARQILAQEAKP